MIPPAPSAKGLIRDATLSVMLSDGPNLRTLECQMRLATMVTMANAGLRWLSKEKPEIGKAQDLLNNIAAAGHQASDIVTNIRALFGKDT